ncbi:MAG: ThiF family adenylyltransferase [Pseudobdellovibrionaceae bacterium]|nr:ThiF family adenylyltransferase [Bdellovibrionales bacterium]USN47753.1 MAG: ThiF family adenylyltransferase [Pseudobdellovibrionaceae bacterium]
MAAPDYSERFGRNIGILTSEEQEQLRKSCVAVAGLGGIGGAALLCLARMGVGRFHLADLDHFDVANLNRQVGANIHTFGRPKVDVMKEQILAINPEIEVKTFTEGVQKHNVAAFVSGVGCVVDSIEYFTLSARELLHHEARKQKIPAVFAAPLGFSAVFLSVSPEGMSFHDYFDINDELDPFEKMLRFTVGLSPKALHLKYMEFKKERLVEIETGPSLALSVNLGAALIGAEVICHLTKRRRPQTLPQYVQIDLLTQKHVRKKLLWGNRGFLQKLKIFYARKKYADFKQLFLKFIN